MIKLKDLLNEKLYNSQGEGYTFGKGDIVKDINPDCPHHGAEGEVIKGGKVKITFRVTNNGTNYKEGDELEKTTDQMVKLNSDELNEAIGKGMKWEDLKVDTTIEYSMGVKYKVTKIGSGKLTMTMSNPGKGTGTSLFAKKANLDKRGFESQVKVGLIKYLVNTNPRIKEGKLTEGWKPIVKKKVKYKTKMDNKMMGFDWEIESGIDTGVGNTPKIILHYVRTELEGEYKGDKISGGNTIYLKHKNGKPYTPQEAKKLVNKISNKKIMDFQRKSNNPSGSGQNVYYQDGKFIREGKLNEAIEPTGGMAKIAAIVKNKQHGKVGGKTVDMQSANLLMKLYNAVKDKDKEKMNKMNEKKLIVVLHKLWSRVNLKLPV